MTIYTFYVCKPDGTAPTFVVHELASDRLAAEQGDALLGEHASCSSIIVCDDDREVCRLERPVKPAPGVQGPMGSVAAALSAGGLDHAAVAVIATNVNGAIGYWNQAAAKLYGWPIDEAIGRNVMEVTPALQSRGKAQSIMRGLQDGIAWEGEITLRRRDGTPFRAYVADLPFGSNDEELVIVGVSSPADRRDAVLLAKPLIVGHLSAATAA